MSRINTCLHCWIQCTSSFVQNVLRSDREIRFGVPYVSTFINSPHKKSPIGKTESGPSFSASRPPIYLQSSSSYRNGFSSLYLWQSITAHKISIISRSFSLFAFQSTLLIALRIVRQTSTISSRSLKLILSCIRLQKNGNRKNVPWMTCSKV